MENEKYFRRCHMCDHVNEVSGDKLEYCECCGKSFAPFFYFDDRYTSVLSDLSMRPPLIQGEYTPIQGLTVYWPAI